MRPVRQPLLARDLGSVNATDRHARVVVERDTQQLHGLCAQYNTRMNGIRKDGYRTPKLKQPARKGKNRQYWYHFIKGEPVQLLNLLKGRRELYRGECELNGHVMKFYEVKAA